MSDSRRQPTPFGKRDDVRRVKLALKRLIGREPRFRIDTRVAMRRFGAWNVALDRLPDGAVVYSLGVGDDIDLDLALIGERDAEVHAFDPTPASVAWLEPQELPAGFHFHPWAVAAADGRLFLYPRVRNDGQVSKDMFTLLPQRGGPGGIEVPSRTLDTIADQLGHDRIDLLKMDIEGAEYDVLDGMLAGRLRPGQLLIEFHHRHAGLDTSLTVQAVTALRAAGYRLVDISCSGREFAFLHDPA